MNLQEQISRILKEDSNIPFVILRRVTPEDIEEAFEFELLDEKEVMSVFKVAKKK
jgi:hypothetical protein